MTGADLIAFFKKQPIAVLGGLVVLLCVLDLYFRADARAETQTQFEAKEKELQIVDSNIRNGAALAEQTAAMQEAGRQFEARLIRASQLAVNLQVFYRLEAETGVKLLDVQQSAIAAPPRNAPIKLYSPIPYSVSVQGAFDQVFDFVRRLETGPQFARFKQVTFIKATAGGENTSADGMIVNFTLEFLGTP